MVCSRSLAIGKDLVCLPDASCQTRPAMADLLPLRALPAARVRTGFLLAAAGLVGLTAAALPLRARLNLSSVLLLFLAVVVLVSVVGGPWPALTSAFAAAGLVNYYFTAPRHTLRIEDGNNVLALAVFVAVAALVSGVVVVLAARTDQVRRNTEQAAAAEIRAAEAEIAIAGDRTRSALLAAVSHDLRSPLASAKAALDSLLSPAVSFDAADTRELLLTAEESVDRLVGLVEDLLQMSRLRAGALAVSMEEVDVATAIAAALEFLRVPTGVVDVGVAPDAATVWADEALLERVLANLLANALRFSPPGRYPRVDARRLAGGKGNGNGAIEVAVTDSGPGVPIADQALMFAPFQRLGDSDTSTGVGLGLAIARGLTEAMGGSLEPRTPNAGGMSMVLQIASAETEADAVERQLNEEHAAAWTVLPG